MTGSTVDRIREQASRRHLRLTDHAVEEMLAEEIALAEVLEAIERCQLLEDYSAHKRGACCLVGGATARGRALHIVCTSALPLLVIITVYEPRPPKWLSPTRRRGQ